MILLATVVAAMLAMAAAEDFTYSAPSAAGFQQPQPYKAYNNYYDHPYREPSLLDALFGSTRRQGLDLIGGGGGSALILIVVVVMIGLALLAAAAYVSTVSSGRGLDTDEWEVDHSVWMDQLQRDFEDSWSTQDT